MDPNALRPEVPDLTDPSALSYAQGCCAVAVELALQVEAQVASISGESSSLSQGGDHGIELGLGRIQGDDIMVLAIRLNHMFAYDHGPASSTWPTGRNPPSRCR